MEKENTQMEKIISLAKRRGFIFPGSEIYGGLAGTWDYGHFGLALKNNIKNLWWKKFVDGRRDMYGVDAAILMRQEVWQATGHVANFADPMINCLKCSKKFRVDQLVTSEKNFQSFLSELEILVPEIYRKSTDIFDFDALLLMNKSSQEGNLKNLIPNNQQLANFIWNALPAAKRYLGPLTTAYLAAAINCPECHSNGEEAWGWPTTAQGNSRHFNMMFQTKVGASEDSSAVSYLRPETAQGMFVNFKNTVDAFHPKLPFGMAQIGKAFRNEITPRDFIFRQREFEQMEIEYFVRPDAWEVSFDMWKDEMNAFMQEVGIDMTKVSELLVPAEDRAFYSEKTVDFEFEFPFGKKELFGLAYRTDYDLNTHKLEYVDEENATKMVPHVIEPSFGVDRAILAVMLSAYAEDGEGDAARVFLKFKPSIAPVICAVSPLLRNKPQLVEKAEEVFALLKKEFGNVMYDDNGNIGKRYRRQDEIGTPWCIVVDFDTLGVESPEKKDTVTIRHRDTGEQERIAIADLKNFIATKLQN